MTGLFTTFFQGSASLCYCAKPEDMVTDEKDAMRWPQSVENAIARVPELHAALLLTAAVSSGHVTVEGEPTRSVLNEVALVDIIARYAALRAPLAVDTEAMLQQLDDRFTPPEAGSNGQWVWIALVVALVVAVTGLVAVAIAPRRPRVQASDTRPAWQ